MFSAMGADESSPEWEIHHRVLAGEGQLALGGGGPTSLMAGTACMCEHGVVKETRFRGACVVATVAVGVTVAVGCSAPEPNADPVVQSAPTVSGATFRLDLEARLAAAGDAMAIVGDDGWLFFGPELRHLTVGAFWGDAAAAVSRSPNPEHADPLPAILDFKAQLEAVGVDLLLVPVPAKAAIYPEQVSLAVAAASPPPDRLDEQAEAFYTLLRERGIEVVDLMDVFLEATSASGDPLYCRQDTHWSGAGCVLAAARLASMIRHRAWFDAVPKRSFDVQSRSVEIAGDLWRLLEDESLPKESVSLRFVGSASDTEIEPVEDDPDSPIVLLGDSHGLVFHVGDDMHARGAGLADQLTYELGFPLDVIAVRGSGATSARFNLLRRARRTPGYWERKRLVIWVFSVREFTEADGWRLVPIDGP